MADEGNQRLPVLIIGGGIGGMCTALALSNGGSNVHVFERSEEFNEMGAGIQVAPNAFSALRALGIEHAIMQVASFPEALIVMDSLSGEEIIRLPVGAEFRDRFGYPYALVHRADLHAVLLKACRGSALVTLSPSKQLAGFEERGDRVRVTMHDRSAYEGVALVGADGLWSTVREAVVGDGPPRVSGHMAYRAVIAASEAPQATLHNAMTIWAGPKTHLVHYPLRGHRQFNLVAVFDSDGCGEVEDFARDANRLKERFRDTRPEVRDVLRKIDTWRPWRLCDREPTNVWSQGCVTLLGDAAHPTLQYLAQGASMAMEDAVCLAAKVGCAGGDFRKAFVDYQQARYLRTARVQLTSRLFGEVLHAGGVARELRNAYLGDRTVEQCYDAMAWLYGGAGESRGRPTEALGWR